MKIKLEDPSFLAKAVEIISELVTEVRIKVGDYGLSINAIDPANVAMVGFKLPKSAFTEFDVPQQEGNPEELGVNLDSLKRILKRSGTKSSLIIEKYENTLKIQIEDKIKREFKLNLIEVESEDKEIPNLDFTSKVKINSNDLVESIEDCAVVDDACAFLIKDGNFAVEAKGMNSARAEFSGDDAEIESKDEEVKAHYSLEYLQKFLKAAKLTEKTLISFASDHPTRLDFNDEHFSLNFLLAPRVEEED